MGGINTVKMPILLKAIYRFNASLNVILYRNRKINPKIHMEALFEICI
jgi:hypothetical protein